MSGNQKFPVIIMAGNDADTKDELLEYASTEYKTLIKISGKTILERELLALHNTGRITKYYIVGVPRELVRLPEEINQDKVVFLETIGKDVPERVEIATDYIIDESKKDPSILQHSNEHVLFITGDIPFITGEIVNEFLVRSEPYSFDFYPTAVSKEVMTSRFPKSNRTYGKMREGGHCLGDIALFRLGIVKARVNKIRTLRQNRKKFLLVILKFKPTGLLRYLIGRLTFPKLNEATSKIFDVSTNFVVMDNAEIAMDIDKPDQLDMAIEELSQELIQN